MSEVYIFNNPYSSNIVLDENRHRSLSLWTENQAQGTQAEFFFLSLTAEMYLEISRKHRLVFPNFSMPRLPKKHELLVEDTLSQTYKKC